MQGLKVDNAQLKVVGLTLSACSEVVFIRAHVRLIFLIVLMCALIYLIVL